MTRRPDVGGPTVSVVMPFLDAAPYLREAVASVLGQTWAAVELLLVDDGGTDGSDRIAGELAAGDPRVRVLAHDGRQNRGIGHSKALALRAARGDLVAFLDADDVWEPQHLADQVALLRAHPDADLVCGRNWAWRSWSEPEGADVLSDLAFAPGAVVSGRRLLAAVVRNGANATATCALLARREALLGVAPHVETFAGLFEDQVVNAWLQLRCTAVMSGSTSAWYRMHDRSISARLGGDQPVRAYVRFLGWVREQLDEQGVDDPELAGLVEGALQRSAGSLTPLPRSARGRLVRAVVPPVVRRHLARVRGALPGRGRGPTEPEAGPVEVAHALHRHGADLRGDVLVLGDGASVAGFTGVTSVAVRPWPGPLVAPGPGHALADLASRAYDCVVVLAGPDGPGDPGLRHVRRALRPAGVLLVVLRRDDAPALAGELREVFGRYAVARDTPGRPFATVFRAFVPAA